MNKILFALTLFFVSTPIFTYASFLPTTITSPDDIVTITGITYPYCYEVFLPSTPEAQSYFSEAPESCVDSSFSGMTWAEIVGDTNGDEFVGNYRLALVNDADINLQYPMNGTFCYDTTYENCITHQSYQGITVFVSFDNTQNNNGKISFIDYDDITPTDMLASVRQGTVDTANKTLPLLVFLGIPLGFLLVLMLINLINNTLTPAKTENVRLGKEVINPTGTDIIYHDPKDLEAKRTYGQRKE